MEMNKSAEHLCLDEIFLFWLKRFVENAANFRKHKMPQILEIDTVDGHWADMGM